MVWLRSAVSKPFFIEQTILHQGADRFSQPAISECASGEGGMASINRVNLSYMKT